METVDPDYMDRLVSRKKEIDAGSGTRPGIAAMLALGSVPIALAALSREVYGQSTLPTAVKGVLDFALALEIFEDEFYKAVLGTSAKASANAAFATVRGAAAAVPGAIATLQQIQKHEAAHRATLLATNATNVFSLNETSFDFTGARGAGNGPFASATTNLGMLLLVAQAAEDTGVRAYKGQAAILLGQPSILEAALRIHSVEARHASRIRRMRRAAAGAGTAIRFSGTVRGEGTTALGADATISAAAVAALQKVYINGANSTTAPSEANVSQAGVNVSALTSFGAEAAQEAFDEPLDRADVIALVQPFFIPDIS
jgi:hypothetical protein